MKRVLAPILLIAAIWLYGCSDPTAPNTPDFTSATTWIYHVDSLDATGSVLLSRFDTVRIASIERSCVFKIITFTDSSVAEMINDGPGFGLVSMNLLPLMCNAAFPVPAHCGDTLVSIRIPTRDLGVVVTNAMQVYVKATSQHIVVPAGAFVCDEFGMSTGVAPNGPHEFFTASVNAVVGVVRKQYYLPDGPSGRMYLCKRIELVGLQ
jgi:hypothetical protein